jgi:hypothetical protein
MLCTAKEKFPFSVASVALNRAPSRLPLFGYLHIPKAYCSILKIAILSIKPAADLLFYSDDFKSPAVLKLLGTEMGHLVC